jgi:hypothetical protein
LKTRRNTDILGKKRSEPGSPCYSKLILEFMLKLILGVHAKACYSKLILEFMLKLAGRVSPF